MRHILLVQVSPYTPTVWRQAFTSGYGADSYDKCMEAAAKVPADMSWMIVQEKRVHAGGETMTTEG